MFCINMSNTKWWVLKLRLRRFDSVRIEGHVNLTILFTEKFQARVAFWLAKYDPASMGVKFTQLTIFSAQLREKFRWKNWKPFGKKFRKVFIHFQNIGVIWGRSRSLIFNVRKHFKFRIQWYFYKNQHSFVNKLQ